MLFIPLSLDDDYLTGFDLPQHHNHSRHQGPEKWIRTSFGGEHNNGDGESLQVLLVLEVLVYGNENIILPYSSGLQKPSVLQSFKASLFDRENFIPGQIPFQVAGDALVKQHSHGR